MKSWLMCFVLMINLAFGQGYNHQWLLGSWDFFIDPKGRMLIDSNGYSLVNENRKMVFYGTEANISDANGNFLMSSNGVWIANAINDTMMNGSGLNPGLGVNSWPYGQILHNANVFLPFPGDSNKFVLFHHSYDINANSISGFEIFKSIVDITLDNGLGGVVSKNDLVLTDTINQGFAACKHANGRDWWIVCQKDNSDTIIRMLLTPFGVQNISTQSLGVPIARFNVTQLTFSQDGTKLAYFRYDQTTLDESVILLDFNRCSGVFSNPSVIPITANEYLWGLAFSATGKYLYTCSSNYIFQIDTATLLVDTVAVYDGFISPGPSCCPTSFWNMYLAANGKIYITSGSGVQHLHEMNFPDSAGIGCDVQQHVISLGYAQLRAVPNHPNYYLGCDTTSGCACLYAGIKENEQHDFRFRVYPNPISNNNLHIGYILPQNQAGVFLIYDVTGKLLFKYSLPQWSNEQSFNLPDLSNGVYNCVITSNNYRASKKLIVIKD